MRTHTRSSKPAEDFSAVESQIHVIRGERVILDMDLARLYGVPTKALNQAVKRNARKFPGDFLLKLARHEGLTLNRSQSVTGAAQKRRSHELTVYAFTEHGALMAATVLNSPQAIAMSVFVIRAFVRMRSAMTDTRELALKLAALEKELTGRIDLHETAIADFMGRLLQLLEPAPSSLATPDKELGFHTTLRPPQTEPNK